MSLAALQIKAEALRRGFDVCGITPADATPHADYFRQWLAAGQAGGMESWLGRDPERRLDLQRVLPAAKSVIVAGINYHQNDRPRRGRIARYALGEDYHDFLIPRLAELAAWIESTDPGAAAKAYVDTGPILEKPLAQRAGLGWQGKSTMLIHRRLGPWLLLGEIITTLELAPDAPAPDNCGSCERCLQACPTGAITGPYRLDARRCIAYLTIELKGAIPEEFRPLIGDRLYGCDECLDVCPWNRFAQSTRETRFQAREYPDARELLALTPAEFKSTFRGSPIARVKRRGLLRNACVVLGNIGTPEDLPALRLAMEDGEELVREHATWAVGQIEARVETEVARGTRQRETPE